MDVIQELDQLIDYIASVRKKGASLTFVPTMGALHEGHLSLVRQALKESDVCITSIFINPTQFSDQSDLEKYPVDIDNDRQILEKTGNHLLFLPSRNMMYPQDKESRKRYFSGKENFEFGELSQIMEGKARPGHFDGVAQIVSRLLQVIPADHLYLGQKDYQQYLIIKEMIRQMDLSTQIKLCAIVREEEGLALSSRNKFLLDNERKDAQVLFKSLSMVKDAWPSDSIKQLEDIAISMIAQKSSIKEVEYFKIVQSKDLQDIDTNNNKEEAIACVAVHLGEIRLIDNMILS